MTVISSRGCGQVESLGLYSFVEQGLAGYGIMAINRSLGKNYKTARLRYESRSVELGHAKKLVTLNQVGHDKLSCNMATDKPRLVNPYCGCSRT